MYNNLFIVGASKPAPTACSDVLHRLQAELTAVLTAREAYTWRGTHTELLEMVYIVYVEEWFTTMRGTPPTFKQLAALIFDCFGCQLPSNPYAYINKSRTRKTHLRQHFLDTYTALCRLHQHPMQCFLVPRPCSVQPAANGFTPNSIAPRAIRTF